jgi:hypothetical protein
MSNPSDDDWPADVRWTPAQHYDTAMENLAGVTDPGQLAFAHAVLYLGRLLAGYLG